MKGDAVGLGTRSRSPSTEIGSCPRRTCLDVSAARICRREQRIRERLHQNHWADYGGVGRVYTNHGGGTVYGPIAIVTSQIPGSNRLYGDCHAEWVRPEEMGRDNTPIVANSQQSHFSHWGNNRPYWW